MDERDIAALAKRELDPIVDDRRETAYRGAAYLTDGLYLPCVLVANATAMVTLAIRRIAETFEDQHVPWWKGGPKFGQGVRYPDIVRTFVAGGNRINPFDIESLEPSRFAIPGARMNDVGGETSMGWTQFAAVMRDGQEFYFGTSWRREFFDLPVGYAGTDVVRIIPKKTGEPLFRDRPFFT